MPFVVRVLAEDLDGWTLENQTSKFYHYRPRLPAEIAEQIQIVSPAPLSELIDQDMVGFINVDKGWMSKKIGARPETKLQLKSPKEVVRSKSRLRLKIKAVDDSRPPRVTLEEYGG